MPDLATVREAIADALAANLDGWQTSAYELSNPTPPSAMVRVGPLAFDQSGDDEGIDEVLIVRTIVGTAGGDIGAQVELDQVLSGTEVKDAVESANPAGVDDLWVSDRTGMTEFVSANGTYIGADWTVKLIWT